MTPDRDALFRLALTPPADAQVPADLGDAIYGEILATPQRRARIPAGRLGWLPSPSPFLATVALLVLLAVALAIVALSSPTPPPILSTYHGGPDRTGVMPGPAPAGLPVAIWDVTRPGALPFNTMPLPAGDRLIVADTSGVVAALDLADGAVRWEVDVGSAVRGAPTIAGDLVVVGTDAGELVALRIATGAEAWRQALANGAIVAPSLAVGDAIYAGTEGGSLFALEPESGRVAWSIGAGGAVTRGPVFSNGVLYVSALGGRLSAIDASSRSIRWQEDFGPAQLGTPAVGGGRLLFGRGLETGVFRDLVAVDIRDAGILWTFDDASGFQVHLGALTAERVFATSEDGTLAALDPADGSVLWEVDLEAKLATLATVVDRIVIVSSEQPSVTAFDVESGRLLWRVDVTGNPTMAAVVDGRAYVGTDLGHVVAIGDGAAR